MITEITTLPDLKNALDSDRLIIIDFFAIWCGPCMRALPKIEAMSVKYPDIKFYKIDYDTVALKEACALLKVESLPTFCFFKDGKYLSRLEGADEITLENMISKYK
uniref:Thioredoxin domain-containing protein n=1 Tax=viral metagenome TaxID=1070528 RepID=A0A6C0C6E2_9ZZZZ